MGEKEFCPKEKAATVEVKADAFAP